MNDEDADKVPSSFSAPGGSYTSVSPPDFEDVDSLPSKRTDLLWTFIYILFSLFELIFLIYCTVASPLLSSSGYGLAIGFFSVYCLYSLAVCGIFSVMIYFFMKIFPRAWFYISYFLFFISTAFMFVSAIIAQQFLIVAVCSIFLVLMALNIFFVHSRLKYTAFLIKASAKIIRKSRGIYVAVFVNVIIAACFAVMAVFAFVYSMNFSTPAMVACIILHVIYFLWSLSLTNAILAIIAGGVTGRQYLYGITGNAINTSVSNPTSAAARSALTTSFGSAALGSLCIIFVHILSAFTSLVPDGGDNSIGSFFLPCFGGIMPVLNWIVKFVSQISFVRVGIYHESFFTAVKSTGRMFKREAGLDLLLINNVIDTMIVMAMIIVGIVGCLCPIILPAIGVVLTNLTPFCIISCFLGVTLVYSLLGILKYCVTAFIVCLIKDPESALDSCPGLLAAIHDLSPEAARSLESRSLRKTQL